MDNEQAENGLKRKLGLFPLSNIVIANMIGAGIFTTSGLLMQDLRNPLLMIGLWIFGGIIATIGCYQGFQTRGGAKGVGQSTTRAVVISSVLILVGDYFIASLLF